MSNIVVSGGVVDRRGCAHRRTADGLTDRAGRWAMVQVGRHGRSVSEVAQDLACDWHTVNDAVIAYGTALVDDDPERIGDPTAVGLDETLLMREGEFRTQHWSTQIVDVNTGQLLDIVAGRDSVEPCAWFAARSEAWRVQIRWATLDLSNSCGRPATYIDRVEVSRTSARSPLSASLR